MTVDNQQFYQYVLDLKVVDSDKLEQALILANQQQINLSDVLYDQDILTDSQIGQVLADISKLPYINLSQLTVPANIASIIPQVYCQEQLVLPFKKDRDGLHLAIVNPDNTQSIDFISKKVGLPLKLYLTTKRDLQTYFENQSVQGSSFTQEVSELLNQANNRLDNETPIIKLVDKIISFGILNRASDIHIEPSETSTLIRFRIDSVLHDITSFKREIHDQIVTRIKVMSRLKIDEHNSAQDGKLQFKTENENVDIRISITPIVHGEKIVMRLLSSKSRQFSLTNLGLSDTNLAKVEKAYKKPFGMILSTGPTGSGKTTTLYSVLKLLNTRDVNIMTIEDPVEYEIDGINQIQVNPLTNLTFSSGLRSIVRQDPNVILVGEIRDNETADIATNAALTGHLVLSTLHTNDAATTVPRLYDMNIEPFIIASSVNCIIGQRLVRQICQKCRTSVEVNIDDFAKYNLSDENLKTLFKSKKISRIYQGAGCTICHDTGYVGRIGIFEVMLIEGEVRDAIAKKTSTKELQALAISSGMATMLEDGLNKVLAGLTTIDEIIRVTNT